MCDFWREKIDYFYYTWNLPYPHVYNLFNLSLQQKIGNLKNCKISKQYDVTSENNLKYQEKFPFSLYALQSSFRAAVVPLLVDSFTIISTSGAIVLAPLCRASRPRAGRASWRVLSSSSRLSLSARQGSSSRAVCRCALGEWGVPSRARALSTRKEGPPPSLSLSFPGRQASNGTEPVQAPRSVGTLRLASFPRYATAAGWLYTRAAGFSTVPLGPLRHSAVERRTIVALVGNRARYINNGLCPTSDSEPSRTRTGSDAFSALREQRAHIRELGEFHSLEISQRAHPWSTADYPEAWSDRRSVIQHHRATFRRRVRRERLDLSLGLSYPLFCDQW